MLIHIPETPGIPAVLREIAALCPRHSSTAEQHGYSLSSPLARASADRPTDRATDRPTACPTRACEDARARDIYRGHGTSEAFHGRSRLRRYTHIFLACVCLLPQPPRRCPICRCRLFEVERSTDRGLRYIGYPVRRLERVSVKECRDDSRGKWKCRRFNKIRKEL